MSLNCLISRLIEHYPVKFKFSGIIIFEPSILKKEERALLRNEAAYLKISLIGRTIAVAQRTTSNTEAGRAKEGISDPAK